MPHCLASAEEWLLPHLAGLKTEADLRGFDLTPALQALLGWDRLAEMDRLVPASFETPLGRKIPIDYDGEVPAIEVRLQEMFGVTHASGGGCGADAGQDHAAVTRPRAGAGDDRPAPVLGDLLRRCQERHARGLSAPSLARGPDGGGTHAARQAEGDMTDLSHLAQPGASFAVRVTPGARRAGVDLAERRDKDQRDRPARGRPRDRGCARGAGRGVGRGEDPADAGAGDEITRQAVPAGRSARRAFQAVAAFGQVQRGGKVADLAEGQGDPHHLVRAGVQLVDGHAILEGADRDIFGQRQVFALIDKGDHGGVEFVLDGEHGERLPGGPQRGNGIRRHDACVRRGFPPPGIC